jgi:mannose-1-phosphate guanylyltransferase/mannose-6-phosphate isomerase
VSKPPRLYPVILSGGSGSRLWPLSREEFPKQLQPLTSERSLLQETALRLGNRVDGIAVAEPIIVCNDAHRFIVAEQLRAAGVEPRAVIIESTGRNTAPAAAVAALLLEDEPDALMLVMPSDHLVRSPDAFRAAVTAAAPVASAGHLVTFGIQPSGPATAYGYIKRGAALGHGAFQVARFVEKPDRATAEKFIADGSYAWNGGIFLWPVKVFLDELSRSEPEIVPRCRAALESGKRDLFFFRLDPQLFAQVPSQSIDYGVMERTALAAVVPVDMGWSDVGSWSALHQESAPDGDGNTLVGDVLTLNTANSYVRSDKQLTAVLGLDNIVVVVTADAVLVADKGHDQQVKSLVDELKRRGRTEATVPARIYRPWGWFQTMDEGHRFKVKRICVKPGAQLSLQKHWHRSEHWVVVSGTAVVVRDGEEFMLRENESTFIAPGCVHRLANPGQVDLHMIEVQSGEYVGEDDIVRIADDYGREGDANAKRPAPKIKAAPKRKAKIKAARRGPAAAVATAAQRKLKARRKAKLAPTAARRVRRHVVRPAAPVGRKKTPPKPPPKPSKPPRKR